MRLYSRHLPILIVCIGIIGAACGSNDLDTTTMDANEVAEDSSSQVNSEGSGNDEARPRSGVPGVTDQSVLFGQSAAFSGPAQALGEGMRLGIEAAFNEVNQQGGVHGRELLLVSYDDTYEPEAAISNTVRLINSDQVFALIGEVGTPTSRSATPIAALAGVPFIAPFTGAAFLRDTRSARDAAFWTNVVNLRASYAQETEEMVARLTTDLGIERIAIMYQDDSFGRTGYQGALAALQRRGMEPVAVGLYPRNTTAVKGGLLDLQSGNPEAVIIVGAYKPVATLIAWARYTGFDPVFITISFVGSNALSAELEALGSYGEGVYVTQVVPFPTDETLPIVSSYLKALEAYEPDSEPGFVSLEGYLTGRLAIAGLEICGPEVNRNCFLNGLLDTTELDMEGFQLSFGEDNQGSDQVFLTVIGPDALYRPTEVLSG